MRTYLKGNVSPRFTNADLTDCCDQFAAEVEDGNFVQAEGKSLLIVGEGSREEAHRWTACLVRANYPVYRSTPVELLRFLAIDCKPDRDDERYQDFQDAACFIVLDVFDPETTGAMLPRECADFIQFVKSGIDDGIVFVFETTDPDTDPDVIGEGFGSFIMEHFETVEINNGEASKDTGTTDPAGDSKHDRSKASGKHSGSSGGKRTKKPKSRRSVTGKS